MEDLLPVLIGIIWLAYTLYNRGQKKSKAKLRESVQKQEPRSPSILEQILLGEQPQPYIAPVVEESFQAMEFKEPDPEPVRKNIRPFLSEELSRFTGEGEPGIEKSAITESPLKETVHVSLIKEMDFDLRKAVIFSEILNAPYIR